MSWPENVRKSDLRIEYYRGSGKGGQHRNKTDSACRITHVPTGIQCCAEEHKSQHQNRKAAFRRLADKLIPLMKQALQPETGPTISNERIRTYHEPRQKVKDDRVPGRSWSYKDVLEGKALGDIIEAVHLNLQEGTNDE